MDTIGRLPYDPPGDNPRTPDRFARVYAALQIKRKLIDIDKKHLKGETVMKKLLTLVLALVLVASVATASAATKLVIGASSTPHAEILEAAKDALAAKDIEL